MTNKRDAAGAPGPIDPYKVGRHDTANAELFVDYWDERLLAIESSPGKWYGWISERWQVYDSGNLNPEFIEAVAQRWKDAANHARERAKQSEREGAPDAEQKLEESGVLAKWANQCHNAARVSPGVRFAHNVAQRRGLSVTEEAFDADPMLLGVKNGILDLETLELRPRSHALRVTKSCACSYDEGATHPDWDSYLDTFIPDLELRAFIQKVMGYAALRGGNPERVLVFLKGETSTGKSVIKDAIRHVLADYGSTVDPSLFKEKREAGATAELVNALSTRFTEMSELGTANRLDNSIIKRLTGNETVSGRLPHSGVVVERVPDFTPVIATNKMPLIPDADDALRRRILVLPFEVQIPDEDKKDSASSDPDVWPAVLAWLVEGWKRYREEGIRPSTWPEAVRKASVGAYMDLSPFEGWWAERVTLAEGFTSGAEVRRDFQCWQEDQAIEEEYRISAASVTQKIAKIKGVKSAVRNKQRGFPGLLLKPIEDA